MSTSTTTTTNPAGGARPVFTKRDLGIVIDESSGSADDCNERTIDFAKDYGFAGLFFGCFDGLRGLGLEMNLDDARDAAHPGECDANVQWLAEQPHISIQLDAIGADKIRDGLRESGAWDENELADIQANRNRATWLAACDIRENASEQLSEMGDEAVDFLNGLDGLAYCSFYFEDNSLFYAPCVENVKESVEFVSSREQDEPEADFRGEWLQMNDHGNCTLYVRNDDGSDTEIWGIV